ncbi:tRNA uridine-5-carboxymethylaminomethyl(34) synthesis GTPase MnmE [Abyssisolibacter fermentans]|uniref:tRNA uridine-5-carboxymethylaminomethyl(34) synthesis GTPase MnmE n=1 Tax=Abyssisolibacter fermentans TaxID=1766203 RepID=UPI001FA6E674|nr:tRNA uridine-5-carboxymethylaminomethyl(34) synthesis GTPase MnmE [Abyssisolibacter fermentans]
MLKLTVKRNKEGEQVSADTIVAIATAPGEAGIGIVRICGKNALKIVDKIFIGKNNKKISENKPRFLTYGYVINPKDNKKIDEVLAVYMKSPYTYTKEDIVEINCHGGIVPVRKILEIVLENGARMAERGEFTKRAFLNGRIDLAQAEAVMDLISAKTNMSYEMSLNQLEGGLSNKIMEIRDKALKMLAHIEVSIDYPEDDIEEITYKELEKYAHEIYVEINKLIQSSETGKILREGIKTIILGKPNVGKSSLLNALLKENRAIVTNVPGTTRDVIEEYITIKGIPLKIIDTAGIRDTDDIVEKIGVDKAKELINSADLIIAVFDKSRELTKEDYDIIDLIKDKNCIVLINKTDLPEELDIQKVINNVGDKKIIESSIVQGEGINVLEKELVNMFFEGRIYTNNDIIINNLRHKNLLKEALLNIEDAMNSIKMNIPIDCLEVDIKQCWENLGRISGETITDDVIDKIFSEFCIGK